MDDGNLAGYFMVPSGVIVVLGSFREMDRSLRPPGTGDYAFAPTAYELRRGLQVPDGVLEVLLTQSHENSHYRQLMSTPLGLMLWRAMNVLGVDVNFLSRHVTGLRPPLWPPGPPLDDWLSGGGLEMFDRALREGATFEPGVKPSVSHQGTELIRYMDFLLSELRVMKFFLTGVLDRSGLRVGDFVEVANFAVEIMNRRSDLKMDAVWSTRLPPDTPLLGDGRFAGNEIIEAAARLEEHRILDLIGVSPGAFEQWQRTRIFGVYQPVYEYLLRELRDVSAALAVLDVTMMTPIDVAFAAAADSALVVEDVLPSFRLPRLVEAARKRFWPRDPDKLSPLVARDLAVAAGLTAPGRVAEVGAGAAYSGENSWSYDERQLGGQLGDLVGRPFDLAQEDVRRAMRKRLTDPTEILMQKDYREPLRPVISFFDDGALLGNPGIRQDWLLSVILSYQKFIRDGVHLALLSQFDTAGLLRCEEAILKRAKGDEGSPNDPFRAATSSLSDEDRRRLFGVREIASQSISENHLYLLQL